MPITEQGVILYPYIINGNELCYEVEINGVIKTKTYLLPTPPSNKVWECFGVDMDWSKNQSTILLDLINI